MNQEIKKRIKSIISILIFLVIATWYWYGPREDITYLATNMQQYYFKSNTKIEVAGNKIMLNNKDYTFKVINQTSEVQNYEILLNNNYIKSRKNDCNILQNNYLKYQLTANELYTYTNNLNIDGIIYRGVLQPNEVINFSIKIKIDKKDIQPDECYFPVLRTSTYYKI